MYYIYIVFKIVECVIRKAIRYPKDDKQGDAIKQQPEENIDLEKKKWISTQVLSILRQTNCDISEVLQFVTDTDLVYMLFTYNYSFLFMNIVVTISIHSVFQRMNHVKWKRAIISQLSLLK